MKKAGLNEWTVTEDHGDGVAVSTVVRDDGETDAPPAGTETAVPESMELKGE